MTKIAILDDYQNAALRCADWSLVEKDADKSVATVLLATGIRGCVPGNLTDDQIESLT